MQSVLDSDGKAVQLGSELGRGGEGAVFEVISAPSLVAKIYHRPLNPLKAEKLTAMVRSGTPELLKFSAWPVSTLHAAGKPVGLLMPRISKGDRPIHQLYTPKTRLRDFPSANWQFLIHVAGNIARGFAAIHNAGHVIGDVNHGNALVGANGITAFIDCDSFQIKANGRVFLCEVGVPTYTPPELQGRNFTSIERTRNHDAFGLAVLIFHLLFMGRHPFAGRFSGVGDMPIERAIAEFRFAFGRNAQQMQMSPPPNSLVLSQVPSVLADAFEKAFNREVTAGAFRPTALEWLSILSQTKEELKRCALHQAHMYFFRLANCPWCPIEDRGIILFIDVSASLKPGLDIESLWKTLQSLQLGSLPPIPTAYNRKISVTALPECIATGIRRRVGIGAGIAAIIATVWAVTVFTLPDFVPLPLVVVSVAFAYWLPQSAQKQRLLRRGTLNESQRKYRDLQNRYASECGEQPFIRRVQELDQLRSAYNGLPLERQRKLRELESRREQLQLYHFLDQFSIHDASISGIGIGRKQMLASYGVDSAADIDNQKLSSVPGFGPKMLSRLMGWRASLERRFRFDPNKAVDRIEIQIIEQEIQSRRSQLEQSISNGVQAAIAMHATISARRSNYIAQIEVSFKELMQAEKNYKAC